MNCPACKARLRTKRVTDMGDTVVRERECTNCGNRLLTQEKTAAKLNSRAKVLPVAHAQ